MSERSKTREATKSVPSEPDERGRGATEPTKIPAMGWRDILLRVKHEIGEDRLSLIAAGVSFYLILALVPGIAGAVSLYGLFSDPAQVTEQFESLSRILPREVHDTVASELRRVASSGRVAGFGAVLSLLLVFWSGSRGMLALLEAMNIVYEEPERRGFFKLNAMALLFTLGGIVLVIIAVLAIVAGRSVLTFLGLGAWSASAIAVGRWLVLVLVSLSALSLLYRFGPNRENARWRWVSWGAGLATIVWLVASYLFSFYLSHFGNYNKTYGSLGAVAVLLMWLYISTFVVLLGGELDAEMEHQTSIDTTTGPPEAMGERGAKMADTVGPVP